MTSKEKRALFGSAKVSDIISFDYYSLENMEKISKNVIGISISGVQDKLSVIVENNAIILTPAGVQGQYIIKPIPNRKDLKYCDNLPANEYLTMHIASEVYKIPTALNGIVRFIDGRYAYITKRFDVMDNSVKLAQEDFASLTAKTEYTAGKNFKYTGSYEDIAKAIDRYISTNKIEKEKLLKIVVFNYMFGNGDAHLKNFSVLENANGDFLLSPAYDLVNTAVHVNDEDFALENGLSSRIEKTEIYSRKGHPCADDFINFGLLIGVPMHRCRKLLLPFRTLNPKIKEMIDNSLLDAVGKRRYWAIVEERYSRFVRE